MRIPPTHHQEDLRNINTLHEPQKSDTLNFPLSSTVSSPTFLSASASPPLSEQLFCLIHHEFCPNIHGLTGQPFLRQIAKEPLPLLLPHVEELVEHFAAQELQHAHLHELSIGSVRFVCWGSEKEVSWILRNSLAASAVEAMTQGGEG
ncbi:hypothetical protein HN51_039882 [Arachis hypogaea]